MNKLYFSDINPIISFKEKAAHFIDLFPYTTTISGPCFFAVGSVPYTALLKTRIKVDKRRLAD